MVFPDPDAFPRTGTAFFVRSGRRAAVENGAVSRTLRERSVAALATVPHVDNYGSRIFAATHCRLVLDKCMEKMRCVKSSEGAVLRDVCWI